MIAGRENLSFIRRLDMSYEQCVTALEYWWAAEGGEHELSVGAGGVLLLAGAERPPSVCLRRLRVRLDRGWLPPALPMELEISRWSSLRGMTYLELVPRRAVRPSRRYFEAGHRLLDALTAGLREHATERHVLTVGI